MTTTCLCEWNADTGERLTTDRACPVHTETDAERTDRHDAVTGHQLPVGTRVRLRHDVERYPHFIAGAGTVGTVTETDEHITCVHMDDHLDGAETWDNEVMWTSDDYYPITDDVQIIAPVKAANQKHTFGEWLVLVWRAIPENKTVKHPMTEAELLHAYEAGVLTHYVAWYMLTGSTTGGLHLRP